MRKLLCLSLLIFVVSIGLSFSGYAAEKESTKILRIAAGESIRDWSSHRETGIYEPELKEAIFERLITSKPGTWELAPGLAESWEYSEDRMQITFKLKKGVQFQKGYGEVTADDVKFSLLKSFDPKWEASSQINSIDHVEVIDRYTVKVYLKHRDSSLLSFHLSIGPGSRIVPKATDKIPVAELRKNPIGSGPYELETWIPMQKIVLKRFEGYHGEPPYFDKIEYSIFPDQLTLELALSKGDMDLGIINYKAIDEFRKEKGFKVYTGPDATYAYIGMCTQRKPFDDVRVRKAIRYAIDVNEIIEGAFEGLPQRANSMFPKELDAYWAEGPYFEPDLKQAKELLAQAGFPNGFETTMIGNPSTRGDLVIPIVIQQLKKIGIKVTPTVVTWPSFVAELQAAKKDMFYFAGVGFARDPFEVSKWFTCEQVRPDGWNMAKWCNAEYDELRMKGQQALNDKEKKSYYIGMQKTMNDACPVIWIHNGMRVIAYKDSIDLEGKVRPDGRLILALMRLK